MVCTQFGQLGMAEYCAPVHNILLRIGDRFIAPDIAVHTYNSGAGNCNAGDTHGINRRKPDNDKYRSVNHSDSNMVWGILAIYY